MVSLIALLMVVPVPVAGTGRGIIGRQQESMLLQTWNQALEGSGTSANAAVSVHARMATTPVTRVVNLLKEMSATLTKEMDEDAAQYDKMACWCNNNEYEKKSEIETEEDTITQLTSTIEELTAKSSGLGSQIKQLDADIAAGKQVIAETRALREKEAKAAHESEKDSIQAIENLQAAIEVLSRHHSTALPQLSWAFLQGTRAGRRNMPWSSEHESRMERSFDEFLARSGLGGDSSEPAPPPLQKFLQQEDASTQAGTRSISSHAAAEHQSERAWSAQETAIVQRAITSAKAFMQAKHDEEYYPSYSAQSGEILGLLKELKEEMSADLSEVQKTEMARAANAAELIASKVAEVESMEKQAEAKEDQLSQADIDLAQSKEELEKTEAALAESQKFMVDLKASCSEAGSSFDERKNARMTELKAVADAISILTSDDARDAFKEGYSFLQLSSQQKGSHQARKLRAAAVLKTVASKLGSPELSIIASRVELDSFSRVKKAIDDMIAMLKQQQTDEVKKVDFCKSEFQENEMSTMKTNEKKVTLSQKAEALSSNIAHLTDEIAADKATIAEMQLDLQRQSEDRKKENMDFQKTVADQRAVQAVLKEAVERLAKYYDEALIQSKKTEETRQAQPVQKTYAPSSGSEGVLQVLEKLIYDAREVEADATKSEQAAQDQYDALVVDTFASIKQLSLLVVQKTEEKTEASKTKFETEGDLKDTEKDLEELAKINTELHGDCDFVVKNFDVRQEARQQEVEALQQAKQILSGAEMSS